MKIIVFINPKRSHLYAIHRLASRCCVAATSPALLWLTTATEGAAEPIKPMYSAAGVVATVTDTGPNSFASESQGANQTSTTQSLSFAASKSSTYGGGGLDSVVTNYADATASLSFFENEPWHVSFIGDIEAHHTKSSYNPPNGGSVANASFSYMYQRPSYATKMTIDFDAGDPWSFKARPTFYDSYLYGDYITGTFGGHGRLAIWFPKGPGEDNFPLNYGLTIEGAVGAGSFWWGEEDMYIKSSGAFDVSVTQESSPYQNSRNADFENHIFLVASTTAISGDMGFDTALVFDQSSDGTYSDALSGSGTFIKDGAGTVSLAGNNSYTGETLVLGGRLNIDGTTSSSSLVDVSYGATIGGSGTIGGSTTISGMHSPGNSPGIQTFGRDLSYQQGGEGSPGVLWELSGNSSVNVNPAIFDQIIVGGDLTFLSQTYLELVFDGYGSTVDWTDPFWSQDEQWTLYSVGGITTDATFLSIQGTNWQDANGLAFGVARPNGHFALLQSGQNLVLSYYASAVPEIDPATGGSALSLVAGVLAMIEQRRRRAALVA